MADFDLSARMTFDGRQAAQGATEVATSIKGVGAAQKDLATSSASAATATGAAATKTNELAAAELKAEIATRKLAEAQRQLGASANASGEEQERAAMGLARAQLSVANSTLAVERATARGTVAGRANAAALAEQSRELTRTGFGARNLGQQVGDFATQVSLGGGVIRAFSSQLGQVGFAASEMGGKIGAVGRFLTGPWGIALTVGALVAAPFVEKLFEASKAAEQQRESLEKAAQAADSFGNAQSLIGKVIDLATGKLKTHNQVLIQTIRLQAQAGLLAAQADQRAATKKLAGTGQQGFFERFAGALPAAGVGTAGFNAQAGQAAANNARSLANQIAPLKKTLDDYATVLNSPLATDKQRGAALNNTLTVLDKLAVKGKVAGRELFDVKQQVLALGTAVNDGRANQMALDAIDGKGIADELVPYSKGGSAKKTRERKARQARTPDTDGLVARVTENISSLTAEFTDAPTFVERARAAVAKLDKDIADLTKRKPPNFEALIASARGAQAVIRDNIAKPYDDFVTSQQEALEVQKLITLGRVDEANALRIVQGLQAQMGPLTDAQRDGVLATVEALRQEQRELEILREGQTKYLNALGEIRETIKGTIAGGVQGLADLPKRLLDTFANLKVEEVFDKVFGETFRELEDQVTGAKSVEDASDRMAAAVDTTSGSLGRLGAAAEAAATGLQTPAIGGAGFAGATGAAGAGGSLLALLAKGNGVTGPNMPEGGGSDIVVTGQKLKQGAETQEFFSNAVGKLSGSVASLFTKPENAKLIGTSIGSFAGKGFAGAATGTLVNSVLSPLGKALGVKTSETGAQIGGAIGSFIPIPGGQIIGSIAGSLLGGLLGPKAKYGNATLTGGESFQTGGNGGDARKQATGLGNSVQSGLQSIVDQLGGQLGGYRVSIGTYDGKFRVSTSGQTGELSFGKKNKSKSTLTDFGDDEAGAVAFAIRDAILDGAVQGLSSAMQNALRSNSDVNKALSEALKVKELETLIGGIGNSIKRVFDDFDAVAKERVRVAKAYGLDLLAVEKINADERAKLVNDTLQSRIGSLTDFLNSTRYGDLSEGTAGEKRAALLDEISKVQADAEAGKEGAAGQLASLIQQLTTTSRDSFGTAGPEFAADRATSISAAERVIQMETDRINQAAGIIAATTATTNAIVAGNALTNETNDLLAQQNAQLRNMTAALQSYSYSNGSGGGADRAATARNVALQ